jgi:hypothetical protein
MQLQLQCDLRGKTVCAIAATCTLVGCLHAASRAMLLAVHGAPLLPHSASTRQACVPHQQAASTLSYSTRRSHLPAVQHTSPATANPPTTHCHFTQHGSVHALFSPIFTPTTTQPQASSSSSRVGPSTTPSPCQVQQLAALLAQAGLPSRPALSCRPHCLRQGP